MPDKAMFSRRVFRKPYLALPAAVAFPGLLIVFVFALISGATSGAPIGAAVLSLSSYSVWLAGWHSKVVLMDTGVVIDNLMVRHIIPWDEVAEFGVENGLYLRVKDGTQVSSFAYGGSLLGNLTGYRYTRRICATMKTESMGIARSRGALSMADDYRHFINIPVVPLLVMVGSFELAAVVAVLLT